MPTDFKRCAKCGQTLNVFVNKSRDGRHCLNCGIYVEQSRYPSPPEQPCDTGFSTPHEQDLFDDDFEN